MRLNLTLFWLTDLTYHIMRPSVNTHRKSAALKSQWPASTALASTVDSCHIFSIAPNRFPVKPVRNAIWSNVNRLPAQQANGLNPEPEKQRAWQPSRRHNLMSSHESLTMGYILLAGGAEFVGRMAIADREAMSLAGGPEAPIRIVPAAAAPDNNHQRAGQNGVNWFKRLGAVNVNALPLIDRKSADDPAVVAALKNSGLIYLLGGFPRHLEQSLAGSKSWQAILNAHQAGAVIAGSSAGAMILCETYYDPRAKKTFSGLGLIPGACVLPHHDAFGKSWAPELSRCLPGTILIGIDEQSGMLDDGPQGRWQVYGAGGVTLYQHDRRLQFAAGQPFELKI
jgi:cyanophycinase